MDSSDPKASLIKLVLDNMADAEMRAVGTAASSTVGLMALQKRAEMWVH